MSHFIVCDGALGTYYSCVGTQFWGSRSKVKVEVPFSDPMYLERTSDEEKAVEAYMYRETPPVKPTLCPGPGL